METKKHKTGVVHNTLAERLLLLKRKVEIRILLVAKILQFCICYGLKKDQ